MNDSQSQLDYLREYTPDVVAALTNLGQASGVLRRQRPLRADPARSVPRSGSTAPNELTTQFPSQRYQGLQVVHGRCPGGAVQPAPDGSSPEPVAAATQLDPARPMRRAALIVAACWSRSRSRPGSSSTTGSCGLRASPRTWSARSSTTPRSRSRARTCGSRARPSARSSRSASPPSKQAAVTLAIDDRGSTPFHANATLRDPPAVADRRDVRRLQPGHLERPGRWRESITAREPGAYFLPVTQTQLAGRLRHRPGHLPGAGPRAARDASSTSSAPAWRHAARI